MITENLLDLSVGMLVYTYPSDGIEIEATVPRPRGFTVYEIVNTIDLGGMSFDGVKDIAKCSDSFVYIVEKVNIDSNIVCTLMKKLMECSYCEPVGLKDSMAIARHVVILRWCKKPITKTHKIVFRNGTFEAFLWLCDSPIIHNGNRFSVRISIEPEHVDVIRRRMQLMEKYDYVFLNFFGYQRFGGLDPITHLLGRLLVKQNWEEFMEHLCRFNRNFAFLEPEKTACRLWYQHEDALRAVKAIPRNYLLFYINAYQSYIFNLTLSKLWLEILNTYNTDLKQALKILSNEYSYIPIVGSSLTVSASKAGAVISDVLEAEGIRPKDFNIDALRLEVKGDLRKVLEKAFNVKVNYGVNEIEIDFVLNRGCYATALLREILRVDPVQYL